MHRGEILDESLLPIRLTAMTPCFRREAGSAGRDTRGVLRVHEFDKVELFAYCAPDQHEEAFADILARAEALLRELGLTYRLLDLCCGDLGTSSARTIDLEVFSPGVDKWLEVSSVSWFATTRRGAPTSATAPPTVPSRWCTRSMDRRWVAADLGGPGRDLPHPGGNGRAARRPRALPRGPRDAHASRALSSKR